MLLGDRRKGAVLALRGAPIPDRGDWDQGHRLARTPSGGRQEPGANGESFPAQKKLARGREVIPGHSRRRPLPSSGFLHVLGEHVDCEWGRSLRRSGSHRSAVSWHRSGLYRRPHRLWHPHRGRPRSPHRGQDRPVPSSRVPSGSTCQMNASFRHMCSWRHRWRRLCA